mgnify:CR=1 FL=1
MSAYAVDKAIRENAQQLRCHQLSQDCLLLQLINRDKIVTKAQSNDENPAFYQEGDKWIVRWNGKTSFINNLDGMHYMEHLISHPRERISVADLYSYVKGLPPINLSTPEVKLNKEQLESLNLTVTDLNSKIAMMKPKDIEILKVQIEAMQEKIEAVELGEEGDLVELKENLETMQKVYRGATSLNGRPRYEKTVKDKIRNTVSKSIDTALQHIKNSDEDLFFHLSENIHKGYNPIYNPNQLPLWNR